jgi:general secretion pathway protein K
MAILPRTSKPAAGRSHAQRGVAVLVALVVLTISASLAATMLWNRNLDVHRSANVLHLDQAREYLLGARDWAEQILKRDAEHGKTDSLGEKWARELPALPIQGGALTGRLVDLQGRFNLNNLVNTNGKANTAALAQFERLLALLHIDPAIAPAIVDWIDPDSRPHRPKGAEDEYYAKLKPPYLAANRPLAAVSELLLVRGVSYRDYQRLLPYVTALPASNVPVNVNTAPWPVIASLAKGIQPEEAQNLVAKRGRKGFKSVSEFQNQLQNKIATGAVSVSSNFFRLTAIARIGRSSLTMYSLLQRGQKGAVTSIRQTLGTL